VSAGRGDAAAVRTEYGQWHAVTVKQWRCARGTRGCIPNPRGLVLARRYYLKTIRAEGCPEHIARVLHRWRQGYAGLHAPDPCRFIRAGRHESFAVGAKSQVPNAVSV